MGKKKDLLCPLIRLIQLNCDLFNFCRVLQLNELLCTKPDGSDANEQLIVHYTPKSKSLTCRSVDVNS